MTIAKVHLTGPATALVSAETSAGLLRLPAAIGRGGFSRTKQEGDGTTPSGLLPLRRVLFRADRLPPPATPRPRAPLSPDDGWCDDPTDRAYNKPVRLPFSARHERLWRDDAFYDIVGILGWNDDPVITGRGSAIFLHVATDDLAPTEGCIALRLPDLLTLLAADLTGLDVAG